MSQTWERLLFAHWPLPPSVLAPLVPPGLALDVRDGQAWLGVVPFRMAWVRPRCLPPLPGMSFFPELNVRTYVAHDGKPGVWFLSLDAARRTAVAIGRRLWNLPYHRARMSLTLEGDEVRYESERRDGSARFVGRYRPTSPVRRSATGSLEHWFTERYALYARDRRGRLLRGEIHHRPWPLQTAEAELDAEGMARCHGLALPPQEPIVHYAHRLEVAVWRPVAVSRD
jgi:uncharacterized protein YqjF (DUF2071 family)